jgi:hypothetical protein
MALVLSPMVLLSLRIIAPLVVLGTAGAAICVAGYFFPAIGFLFWPRAVKVVALGGLLAGGAAAFDALDDAARISQRRLGLHRGRDSLLGAGLLAPPPSPEEQKKFHSLFSKTIYGISET